MANLKKVFKMPNPVKITGRTSSITNSFVNGIIPVVQPSEKEVKDALETLGMTENTLCCAYCGDSCTEWDHFHPLIRNKIPTGYISEIHNLVPACSKCNESKGCREWSEWINSDADKSPKTRGISDLDTRIEKLKVYEQKYKCLVIDFKSVVGETEWNLYWSKKEAIIREMESAQEHSNIIKEIILRHFNAQYQTVPTIQSPLKLPVSQQDKSSSFTQPVKLANEMLSQKQNTVMSFTSSNYDYEDFKDWLLLNGIGAAAARNYTYALNRILEDADMDFEEFAGNIDEMLPLYVRGGEKESLGFIYSGAGKAIVKKISEYVLERDVDTTPIDGLMEDVVVDDDNSAKIAATSSSVLNVTYDVVEFKSWLIEQGHSPNVANAYMVAMRKILCDAGMEFHEFAAHILNLAPSYRKGGLKEDMGNVNSGAGRAVVNKLCKFVQGKVQHTDNLNGVEQPSIEEGDVASRRYDLTEFKNWLITQGLTPNVANAYMVAMRKILHDAEMEFQAFAMRIAELAPSYRRGGEKEDMGNVNSGSGRAVINKLALYVSEKQ